MLSTSSNHLDHEPSCLQNCEAFGANISFALIPDVSFGDGRKIGVLVLDQPDQLFG